MKRFGFSMSSETPANVANARDGECTNDDEWKQRIQSEKKKKINKKEKINENPLLFRLENIVLNKLISGISTLSAIRKEPHNNQFKS